MEPSSKRAARKQKATEQIVAHIFLRSTSGKSIRELGQGSLPGDLAAYRPPASAREQVSRFFKEAGFQVFSDPEGLTLSIHGPPSLFAKVFGVPKQMVSNPPGTETVALRSPAKTESLIEHIVVVPAPEMHV